MMNSVENDIKSLVEATIDAHFERLGLDEPAFAQFDVVTGAAGINVTVSVLTEQPVGVIRESRDLVARALTKRGYRVEPATEPATAPEVRLTVMSTMPTTDYLAGYEPARLRDYLTVGGMAAASLMMLIIAVLMFKQLRRAVRRRGTAVVVQPRSPQQVAASPEPTFADAVGGLPPLPDPTTAQPMASVDQLLVASAPQVDHGPIDIAALAHAPKADVRSAFSQLSLDNALELLAAVDPETSRIIIEKLQLHRSVRERLEEGLALLRSQS